METKQGISPEGEKVTFLTGEEGDDHDHRSGGEDGCNCNNFIEGEE